MKLHSALTSGQFYEDFWNEIKQYPNGTRVLSRTEPGSAGDIVPGADEHMTVPRNAQVGGTIVHSKDFSGVVWDDGVKWQSTFDSHSGGFGMILDEGRGDTYKMDKTGIRLFGPA
jgi:hypothetical protein